MNKAQESNSLFVKIADLAESHILNFRETSAFHAQIRTGHMTVTSIWLVQDAWRVFNLDFMTRSLVTSDELFVIELACAKCLSDIPLGFAVPDLDRAWFGKYKGQLWHDIDAKYLKWCCDVQTMGSGHALRELDRRGIAT